ncbi:MAG TPA: hypothetical protein VMB25_04350 [Bryobacteraceae bacterium]|nr:hypothetical protein [Bryobacteraceae bacterium]
MSGKLRILDLALLVVLVLLGWQLQHERVQTAARQQALLDSAPPPTGVPGLPPLPKVEPVTPAAYADIATQDLFSADRNPNVIVDPPKPAPEKPPPPFPVAHGVMLWEGVPPTVVLSEKSGGAQHGYHPGEKVGPWTVVSIDNRYIDLQWEGKEFKKRIDELLDRAPVVAEAPPPVRGSPRPPPPKAQPTSDIKAGPGADQGGGMKGCVAGDSSPNGTVVDGMKKIVVATPFGSSCHWEQAK